MARENCGAVAQLGEHISRNTNEIEVQALSAPPMLAAGPEMALFFYNYHKVDGLVGVWVAITAYVTEK